MGAQVEKTLALIKPDAVQQGDTDNILQVPVPQH
jgi:nucleoside diphosphate kinase